MNLLHRVASRRLVPLLLAATSAYAAPGAEVRPTEPFAVRAPGLAFGVRSVLAPAAPLAQAPLQALAPLTQPLLIPFSVAPLEPTGPAPVKKGGGASVAATRTLAFKEAAKAASSEAAAASAGRWFDAAARPSAILSADEGSPKPGIERRPGARVEVDPQSQPHELWVAFKPSMDKARAKALLAEHGLNAGEVLALGPRLSLQGFAKDAAHAAAAAEALAAAPGVQKLSLHPAARRLLEARLNPPPARETEVAAPSHTEPAPAAPAETSRPVPAPDTGASSRPELYRLDGQDTAAGMLLQFRPGAAVRDGLNLAGRLGLRVMGLGAGPEGIHVMADGAALRERIDDLALTIRRLLSEPGLAWIGLGEELFDRVRTQLASDPLAAPAEAAASPEEPMTVETSARVGGAVGVVIIDQLRAFDVVLMLESRVGEAAARALAARLRLKVVQAGSMESGERWVHAAASERGFASPEETARLALGLFEEPGLIRVGLHHATAELLRDFLNGNRLAERAAADNARKITGGPAPGPRHFWVKVAGNRLAEIGARYDLVPDAAQEDRLDDGSEEARWVLFTVPTDARGEPPPVSARDAALKALELAQDPAVVELKVGEDVRGEVRALLEPAAPAATAASPSASPEPQRRIGRLEEGTETLHIRFKPGVAPETVRDLLTDFGFQPHQTSFAGPRDVYVHPSSAEDAAGDARTVAAWAETDEVLVSPDVYALLERETPSSTRENP